MKESTRTLVASLLAGLVGFFGILISTNDSFRGDRNATKAQNDNAKNSPTEPYPDGARFVSQDPKYSSPESNPIRQPDNRNPSSPARNDGAQILPAEAKAQNAVAEHREKHFVLSVVDAWIGSAPIHEWTDMPPALERRLEKRNQDFLKGLKEKGIDTSDLERVSDIPLSQRISNHRRVNRSLCLTIEIRNTYRFQIIEYWSHINLNETTEFSVVKPYPLLDIAPVYRIKDGKFEHIISSNLTLNQGHIRVDGQLSCDTLGQYRTTIHPGHVIRDVQVFDMPTWKKIPIDRDENVILTIRKEAIQIAGEPCAEKDFTVEIPASRIKGF
jgi:hypothetical protein